MNKLHYESVYSGIVLRTVYPYVFTVLTIIAPTTTVIASIK